MALPNRRRPLSVADHVAGVRAGDRTVLARAITLIESHRPEHQHRRRRSCWQLLPHAGNAQRIGITGVPGVGKSTFIDAFGMLLVEAGHKVAVLAVDPSSSRTGGSILGDKTRMARLAAAPAAYIRPSPTGGHAGRRGPHDARDHAAVRGRRASTWCWSRPWALASPRRWWPAWSTCSWR